MEGPGPQGSSDFSGDSPHGFCGVWLVYFLFRVFFFFFNWYVVDLPLVFCGWFCVALVLGQPYRPWRYAKKDSEKYLF